MTTLQPGQRVIRETAAMYPPRGHRRRFLIAELTQHALILREKGRRDRVIVPFEVAMDVGYKLRAKELRAEKLEAKRVGHQNASCISEPDQIV